MKRSTLSVFLAGAAALSSAAAIPAALADSPTGGMQEWTTEQGIEAEAVKDAEALEAEAKALEEDLCVPIGEGENCW